MKNDAMLQAMWDTVVESTDGPWGGNPYLNYDLTMQGWKRLLKRRGLISKTRVVVKLGNGHWLCSSDSRPGDFHSIEYAGSSDYTCSCEDAQLNKNEECKHVTTIREIEQHV